MAPLERKKEFLAQNDNSYSYVNLHILGNFIISDWSLSPALGSLAWTEGPLGLIDSGRHTHL